MRDLAGQGESAVPGSASWTVNTEVAYDEP